LIMGAYEYRNILYLGSKFRNVINKKGYYIKRI